MFPVSQGHTNLAMSMSCNAVEVFFLLSAAWIFALKYYESASEVSIMLNSEIATLLQTD